MVVDTSAILAISFEEPTADWVSEQIDGAERVLMSTVNLAEALIRFRDRKPDRADELQAELLATGIQFIPPDRASGPGCQRPRHLSFELGRLLRLRVGENRKPSTAHPRSRLPGG